MIRNKITTQEEHQHPTGMHITLHVKSFL